MSQHAGHWGRAQSAPGAQCSISQAKKLDPPLSCPPPAPTETLHGCVESLSILARIEVREIMDRAAVPSTLQGREVEWSVSTLMLTVTALRGMCLSVGEVTIISPSEHSALSCMASLSSASWNALAMLA